MNNKYPSLKLQVLHDKNKNFWKEIKKKNKKAKEEYL